MAAIFIGLSVLLVNINYATCDEKWKWFPTQKNMSNCLSKLVFTQMYMVAVNP